jgi:phosphoesterase RecJ-like protein
MPKLAEDIYQLIQDSENVLLVCHPGPDGDSLGSNIAMYNYIKSLGKEATIISGDDNPPHYLSFMPGYDLIQISNFADFNKADFDLLLICDMPTIKRISNLSEIHIPNHLKVAIVDHHPLEETMFDAEYRDPDCISACQLVYRLLKSWGVEITPDMAAALFIGNFTDSGGFRYQLVNAETFTMASELVSVYPDFHKLIFEMDNNNTKDRLKFEGLMLGNIETFFNDQVAISSITLAKIESNKIPPEEASGANIANRLKSVTGWELGISLVEKRPGKVAVGFRTREVETHPVTPIAQKVGGGGHKAASGALISGTVEQAKKMILEAIAETYPEFGKP